MEEARGMEERRDGERRGGMEERDRERGRRDGRRG